MKAINSGCSGLTIFRGGKDQYKGEKTSGRKGGEGMVLCDRSLSA